MKPGTYWIELWFSDDEDREPFNMEFNEIPESGSMLVMSDGEMIQIVNIWWKQDEERMEAYPTLHCNSLGKEEE